MARLRIFAGPNGSGKSTLFRRLEGQFQLGHYLNADDLFKELSDSRALDLDAFGLKAQERDWSTFWKTHGLKDRAPGLVESHMDRNILVFKQSPKSYETAILTDFLRHALLKSDQSFSFETVFSHPAKIEFIKKAVSRGYKFYLYFATVSSPEISIERVRQRVQEGGHDVPEDKIRTRYERAMDQLLPAVRLAHRAYFFDNSLEMELVAEVSPEQNLRIHTEQVPLWFNDYVLERL